MKKLISLLLVFCLAFTAVSVLAEEDDYDYLAENPDAKPFDSIWVAADGDWRAEVYMEDGGPKISVIHKLEGKRDVWEYTCDLKDKTLDDFQQMIARKECSLSTSRGKSEMAKMNEPFKEVSFTPEEKRKISTMLDDMMPYWKQVQAESGNPNEYSDCIEAGNILRYQLARDPIMFSEKEENQILIFI